MNRNIRVLPLTIEERKNAIYSEEGKPIRKFLGDNLLKNILTCHESDHEFFKYFSEDEELNFYCTGTKKN